MPSTTDSAPSPGSSLSAGHRASGRIGSALALACLLFACDYSDEEPSFAGPAGDPPVARLSIDPPCGVPGTLFSLDASASSDDLTADEELRFRFDLDGDGSWDTPWASEAVHAFMCVTPTESARLAVRDAGGQVGVMHFALGQAEVLPDLELELLQTGLLPFNGDPQGSAVFETAILLHNHGALARNTLSLPYVDVYRNGGDDLLGRIPCVATQGLQEWPGLVQAGGSRALLLRTQADNGVTLPCVEGLAWRLPLFHEGCHTGIELEGQWDMPAAPPAQGLQMEIGNLSWTYPTLHTGSAYGLLSAQIRLLNNGPSRIEGLSFRTARLYPRDDYGAGRSFRVIHGEDPFSGALEPGEERLLEVRTAESLLLDFECERDWLIEMPLWQGHCSTERRVEGIALAGSSAALQVDVLQTRLMLSPSSAFLIELDLVLENPLNEELDALQLMAFLDAEGVPDWETSLLLSRPDGTRPSLMGGQRDTLRLHSETFQASVDSHDVLSLRLWGLHRGCPLDLQGAEPMQLSFVGYGGETPDEAVWIQPFDEPSGWPQQSYFTLLGNTFSFHNFFENASGFPPCCGSDSTCEWEYQYTAGKDVFYRFELSRHQHLAIELRSHQQEFFPVGVLMDSLGTVFRSFIGSTELLYPEAGRYLIGVDGTTGTYHCTSSNGSVYEENYLASGPFNLTFRPAIPIVAP